jgi:hypothetical protein
VLQWGSGEEKFKFMYENLQGKSASTKLAWEGVIPLC